MKKFTLPLAFLLCCAWMMVVAGLPLALEPFKNFKFEFPSTAIWSLNLLHTPFLLLCTAGVLLSGLLLAQQKRIGWSLSFGVCLLCDLMIVSFVLPFFELAKSIGTSTFLNNGGVILLIASVVLVQSLLWMLWVKRNDWMQSTPAV